MAKHNELGEIGERVAENFLSRKGFEILGRNYRKKWGEIDIIASREGKVRFVEVKTVRRKSFRGSVEPLGGDNYRPEDNMHPWKVKRLYRAIQTYLLDTYKDNEPDWQLDLACVYLDMEKRVGKVRYIEDVVI